MKAADSAQTRLEHSEAGIVPSRRWGCLGCRCCSKVWCPEACQWSCKCGGRLAHRRPQACSPLCNISLRLTDDCRVPGTHGLQTGRH